MTQEQIERNRFFIKRLRENKRKAKKAMRDSKGGRCCLCVALDAACELGFKFISPYDLDHMLPPNEMADFYGWLSPDPNIGNFVASDYNDGQWDIKALSHKQIANLFEKTFPEIK